MTSKAVVFRTNTAYDRWWEGRKLWGSLVNNSRNFAIKLSAILEDENDKQFFRKAIPSYANVLHKHLKNEDTAKQLFDEKYRALFSEGSGKPENELIADLKKLISDFEIQVEKQSRKER